MFRKVNTKKLSGRLFATTRTGGEKTGADPIRGKVSSVCVSLVMYLILGWFVWRKEKFLDGYETEAFTVQFISERLPQLFPNCSL